MDKFRRVTTMDDVRAAIGSSELFFEKFLESIESDKMAFIGNDGDDEWIPTIRDCVEHECDEMFCDEGWIIDNTDHKAYLLEEIYEAKSGITFLMRTESDGTMAFCGWYHGEPNEDDTQEFYAEYTLA